MPAHRALIEGPRGLAGVPGHVSHAPGSFSSRDKTFLVPRAALTQRPGSRQLQSPRQPLAARFRGTATGSQSPVGEPRAALEGRAELSAARCPARRPGLREQVRGPAPSPGLKPIGLCRSSFQNTASRPRAPPGVGRLCACIEPLLRMWALGWVRLYVLVSVAGRTVY